MAGGGRELADRGRRALDLLRRVLAWRRQRLHDSLAGRIRLTADRVAVAVRHHDEEPAAVLERQLETEELGVLLRFVVQREGRAEVVARSDDRDSDLEVVLVRGADRVGEAPGRARVDLRVE